MELRQLGCLLKEGLDGLDTAEWVFWWKGVPAVGRVVRTAAIHDSPRLFHGKRELSPGDL